MLPQSFTTNRHTFSQRYAQPAVGKVPSTRNTQARFIDERSSCADSTAYWKKKQEYLDDVALTNCNKFNRELHELFESSLAINNSNERLPSADSGIAETEYSYYDDATTFCSDGTRASPDSTIEADDHTASGFSVDSTLQPWELPGLAQQLAVMKQAEYYFSDDYLSRDAYFLRQIRRKKEGYLSIKLITNFKKLRKLVKDPRVTAYCLRKSKLLFVNEEGTKVKRIQNVPTDLKRFQVRNSVIVLGIPERLANIESITHIFHNCGDLSSVRLLRPGKDCPADILEHLQKINDKSIWIQTNAIIEYERADSALAACRLLKDSRTSLGIKKVCLLANDSKTRCHQDKEYKRYVRSEQPRTENFPFYDSYQGAVTKSKTPHTFTTLNDVNEKEENNSDNAWIQDVVNQVLHQSSKILSDYSSDGISYKSLTENTDSLKRILTNVSENYERKSDYAKLHGNVYSLTS